MLILRVVLICAMLTVFGIALTRAQDIVENQHKVILSINTVGGLCPYGGCHSELLIYDNGTGLFRDGPREKPSREKSFTVDPAELIELFTLIKKTNFEDLHKNKFTGTCPTAYDGSELIYSFSTAHGEEVLDSCKEMLDQQNPLFQIILNIQTKAYYSSGKH
jgi:hypothetical protein